jgi:hypothetical protein
LTGSRPAFEHRAMKRVNYDGQTLVTGDAVAEALARYSMAVTRMEAGTTVEVPVLEPDGSIRKHTLLLTTATSLEVEPFERAPEPADTELELRRFPVPEFEPVGGKGVPVAPEEEDIRPDI